MVSNEAYSLVNVAYILEAKLLIIRLVNRVSAWGRRAVGGSGGGVGVVPDAHPFEQIHCG